MCKTFDAVSDSVISQFVIKRSNIEQKIFLPSKFISFHLLTSFTLLVAK